MQITIRNNTPIPNKYIRYIKWKLYTAKTKFEQLLYVDIHLNTEGQNPKMYIANIRLGIPGNDIILRNKATEPAILFTESSNAIRRYLAKHKKKHAESVK